MQALILFGNTGRDTQFLRLKKRDDESGLKDADRCTWLKTGPGSGANG